VFANLSGTGRGRSRHRSKVWMHGARAPNVTNWSRRHARFDSPWNGKIMVENFMESYHHIGPHAGSLQLVQARRFGPIPTTAARSPILENPRGRRRLRFVVACIFRFTLIAVTESATPWGRGYQFDRGSNATVSCCAFTLAADPAQAAAPELVAR